MMRLIKNSFKIKQNKIDNYFINIKQFIFIYTVFHIRL